MSSVQMPGDLAGSPRISIAADRKPRARRPHPRRARILVRAALRGGYVLTLLPAHLLACWLVFETPGTANEGLNVAVASLLAATLALVPAPDRGLLRADGGLKLVSRCGLVWALAYAAVAGAGLLAAPSFETWLTWLVAWSTLGAGALVAWHLVAGWIWTTAPIRDLFAERAAFVAATPSAVALLQRWLVGTRSTVKIVAAACPSDARPADLGPEVANVNGIADLAREGGSLAIERVLVARETSVASTDIAAELEPLRGAAVTVDVIEATEDAPVCTRLMMRPLGDGQAVAKRLLDVLLASLAIVFLAPVLAVIAVAIRLESPGPVLFRQTREGYRGQPFGILKFRSMHVHAPDAGRLAQACRDDPRVTRIGRLLRCTSVDELAQLFNVLRGDMSIVGPRPHAVEHGLFFGTRIPGYAARHRMKPGITGWAQVNGLRGETETLDKMRARVEHDLWYAEHWSFWLDLKIILRTFRVVLHPNAY